MVTHFIQLLLEMLLVHCWQAENGKTFKMHKIVFELKLLRECTDVLLLLVHFNIWVFSHFSHLWKLLINQLQFSFVSSFVGKYVPSWERSSSSYSGTCAQFSHIKFENVFFMFVFKPTVGNKSMDSSHQWKDRQR